jgi:phosphoribosyl 1,2-cyclic phosphodiesterase
MFVKFWGVRGSIPTPEHASRIYGGNTSCVEVRSNDGLFILDAGTGIRRLGSDLMGRGLANINVNFLFSHPHWDHIQGFPFFTPAYIPGNTLNVYDVGSEHKIAKLLSGQMSSGYFPVDFKDLGGNVVPQQLQEGRQVIDGITVSYLKQVHPGGSFAYCLEADGKKVIYATDSEIDSHFKSSSVPFDVDSNLAQLRPIPQKYIDFMHNADLLIADAQYLDEEYPTKVGWGHPRATTVVDLAIQADVKRLALFHHDPMESDDDVNRKLDLCRQRARHHRCELDIFAARELVELRII